MEKLADQPWLIKRGRINTKLQKYTALLYKMLKNDTAIPVYRSNYLNAQLESGLKPQKRMSFGVENIIVPSPKS